MPGTRDGMVTEMEKENLLLFTNSPDRLRWDVEVDVLVIGGAVSAVGRFQREGVVAVMGAYQSAVTLVTTQ